MRKLTPDINKTFIMYVETKRREFTITGIIFIPMDSQLMSKYFLSNFRKLIKRNG